ncbi:hypothetical protein H4F99_09230 [Lysobacter sp. SG-8]|uniref:Uncharacterized protein n=2 Tax=Marilutibacter penaei TaxID=2759900 RepID=A0A7W3U4W3_9GAMM|nr:hypothetical protein [Lysobacter penaei]
MPWLFLLLAFAALAAAFLTSSPGVLALCLLLSLGFTVAWVMGLLARRVGDASRDVATIVDTAELQRLREAAEARRRAEAVTPPPAPPSN